MSFPVLALQYVREKRPSILSSTLSQMEVKFLDKVWRHRYGPSNHFWPLGDQSFTDDIITVVVCPSSELILDMHISKPCLNLTPSSSELLCLLA